jgi:D-alanyl-D-alanine carboxypeptidase
MITRSDNAATTALWRASGRDRGVAGAAAALGLRDTTRVPVLLLPWDGWQTSAEDQVRLLRAIAVGRDAGSAFTRSLMAQVVAEQAWGVGAVPGATGVKNGWVPVRGRWVVNSDGCVAARGRRLCLSVLSSGSRSFGEGVRTVELAAAAAVRAWG